MPPNHVVTSGTRKHPFRHAHRLFVQTFIFVYRVYHPLPVTGAHNSQNFTLDVLSPDGVFYNRADLFKQFGMGLGC